MRWAALHACIRNTHPALRQLVVIADLNVVRIAVNESKTYPPLIIDRDRVLTLPIAL